MTEPSGRRRPRRRHAALASRVLVTGLAAGSSVGLIGALALGDPTPAEQPPTATATSDSAAPSTTVDDLPPASGTAPAVTAPPDSTPTTTTSGAS